MFKGYVRPQVESNMVAFSPITIESIDLLESVQRKFTRFLPGMANLSYKERLLNLGLKSLEERRIIIDLVFLYKLINGRLGISFDDFFTFGNSITRGHDFKLYINKYNIECRKYFFSNRVVHIWNQLPANIPKADTLHEFRDLLDGLDLTKYCRGTIFR